MTCMCLETFSLNKSGINTTYFEIPIGMFLFKNTFQIYHFFYTIYFHYHLSIFKFKPIGRGQIFHHQLDLILPDWGEKNPRHKMRKSSLLIGVERREQPPPLICAEFRCDGALLYLSLVQWFIVSSSLWFVNTAFLGSTIPYFICVYSNLVNFVL